MQIFRNPWSPGLGARGGEKTAALSAQINVRAGVARREFVSFATETPVNAGYQEGGGESECWERKGKMGRRQRWKKEKCAVTRMRVCEWCVPRVLV